MGYLLRLIACSWRFASRLSPHCSIIPEASRSTTPSSSPCVTSCKIPQPGPDTPLLKHFQSNRPVSVLTPRQTSVPQHLSLLSPRSWLWACFVFVKPLHKYYCSTVHKSYQILWWNRKHCSSLSTISASSSQSHSTYYIRIFGWFLKVINTYM